MMVPQEKLRLVRLSLLQLSRACDKHLNTSLASLKNHFNFLFWSQDVPVLIILSTKLLHRSMDWILWLRMLSCNPVVIFQNSFALSASNRDPRSISVVFSQLTSSCFTNLPDKWLNSEEGLVGITAAIVPAYETQAEGGCLGKPSQEGRGQT